MRHLLVMSVLAASVFAQPKTILAIGAHAGDMEITAGATLLHQKKAGDRVVFLHLTLGEGGNPKLAADKYGEQKRAETLAADKALGAEVRFGPYRDGQIPDNDEVRRWIADVIRDVQPSVVITHWGKSIHKDHALTHVLVKDAVLVASLDDVKSSHPAYRGVRSVLYAENWEDPDDFKPYLYVDVSDVVEEWKAAVRMFEFIRGGVSSFRYFDYYDALTKLRGVEARHTAAQAFEVEPMSKRRVVDRLP